MKRIYLDWAAAAPVSSKALRASTHASKAFGNPSSPHEEGRAARALLEDARVRIARLASVKQSAVLFTSGATEANALAIEGQIRAHLRKGTAAQKLHVLYLPSAHASTRGAIEAVKALGVSVEPLSVSGGVLDLGAIKNQLRPETVLVAVEAVCGETGTRFDTRGIKRALDASGIKGIRLHVDASQLPLIGPFDLIRLSADTLSLDAQKVGGVRGIGVLIAPQTVALEPLVRGGGQERGIRPGTEPVALAAAFATALEEAHDACESFALRANTMRTHLLKSLSDTLPNVEENGGPNHAPHILNVSLIGRDTDYLVALLDEAGFAVSTRSACATDSEGSVAVQAFTHDPARAKATLRISWGPATSRGDLTRFAEALTRLVRFIDAHTV